jgi:predicted ATP-grasp superfamily ATP-dependent carboligase
MTAPRILVMDVQHRSGLAAMRCLHDAGYEVSASARARASAGLRSRAYSAHVVLPDIRLGMAAFVTRLEEFLASLPHDLLLPGTDQSLVAVSAHRERLGRLVELGLPSMPVVHRSLDKVALAREAERAGLATPEGRVCATVDEALAAARDFGFPVLVKGVRTIERRGDAVIRYPSRLVADERAMREAQVEIGTCIVQRRVAGDVLSFGGVITDDGLIGAVLSRYRRTWPPTAGNVTCSETIVLPDGLLERVRALVAALGWRGLFELELIEVGGEIMAIDFNPRPYGSLTLAQASGAPLTALWCAYVLGQGVTPVRARPGVVYRWEDADVRNIFWQLREGNYRTAVSAMLPRRRTAHAYFRIRDPLPLVARAGELSLHRVRKAPG